MMFTCPHGRMSYNDNTEPPKCKYSPRLIGCIHTVHLRTHLRGTSLMHVSNIQDSQKNMQDKQNTGAD